MGSDKALLTFHDQTLLARVLNTAGTVADRVVIVGSRERYAKYGEVIEDVYAGCGPLGGIHAALRATETDLNLVLSVDMPLMTAEFLRWLLERAGKAGEWMVVPDALGGQQPLCAVYRQAVQALAEYALKNGDYKIGHMFSRAPTRYIFEAEMRQAGFSPEIFSNINTAGEFESLLRDQSATLTGKGRTTRE
jgi:molybdopterin-guanine dinucleotide biosynthesis protein A